LEQEARARSVADRDLMSPEVRRMLDRASVHLLEIVADWKVNRPEVHAEWLRVEEVDRQARARNPNGPMILPETNEATWASPFCVEFFSAHDRALALVVREELTHVEEPDE